MKHKNLITLFIFLFFFTSFAYADDIVTNLDNNLLDVGKVSEGKVVIKSFFIINNGSLPVKISVEALGCACFDVISPKGKIELASGERQEIKLNFDTTGFDGKISKPLYIYVKSQEVDTVIRVDVAADVVADSQRFIERFLGFSSLAILAVGLVDGINPCAFTVMVFFVSFLTFAGYRKKDMLIVGGSFILAIYLTYILIGLGMFRALRNLEIFAYFSRIFYILIAGFAFILGLINLYDFWIYKKTKDTGKIVIKLPSLLKRKIQSIIRENLIKKKTQKNLFPLIIASLSCGFLVSVLELFCTGQLYLPTIAYILKIPDLRVRAIFYLLLYNFMFIVPLVGVFMLAFFGFTSSRFERIARSHLAGVKLATAFVFLGLGAVLWIFRG